MLGALGLRVKRRGFAAQAVFSTAWRLSWIPAAGVDLDRVRVFSPIRNAVLVVVIGEEHAAERAGVLQQPNVREKPGSTSAS